MWILQCRTTCSLVRLDEFRRIRMHVLGRHTHYQTVRLPPASIWATSLSNYSDAATWILTRQVHIMALCSTVVSSTNRNSGSWVRITGSRLDEDVTGLTSACSVKFKNLNDVEMNFEQCLPSRFGLRFSWSAIDLGHLKAFSFHGFSGQRGIFLSVISTVSAICLATRQSTTLTPALCRLSGDKHAKNNRKVNKDRLEIQWIFSSGHYSVNFKWTLNVVCKLKFSTRELKGPNRDCIKLFWLKTFQWKEVWRSFRHEKVSIIDEKQYAHWYFKY